MSLAKPLFFVKTKLLLGTSEKKHQKNIKTVILSLKVKDFLPGGRAENQNPIFLDGWLAGWLAGQKYKILAPQGVWGYEFQWFLLDVLTFLYVFYFFLYFFRFFYILLDTLARFS